jgi:hypothetical protein
VPYALSAKSVRCASEYGIPCSTMGLSYWNLGDAERSLHRLATTSLFPARISSDANHKEWRFKNASTHIHYIIIFLLDLVATIT